MMIKKRFLALSISILLVALGNSPAFAGSLRRVVLEQVGSDFIVAGGKTINININTEVRNIHGQKVSQDHLFAQYTVNIYYTPKKGGFPLATMIEVVKEPSGT